MAVWNEEYDFSTDVYSDGEIEDTLLSIVREHKEIDDSVIGNDFVLAYHLSPIRENILNWYPFHKEDSILEIGAGCGAITGVLCQKAGEVVSVDLSKRRSLINYERHKECDNLTVMVGNFNDIPLSHQFDYVVLNGVLEYAMSFTHTEHPYEDFLKNISSFLKEDGKIIIAIENKLGLKYFNGSKEDHVGDYFTGLNGYPNNDWVRTFTKNELTELLKSVGFPCIQFYYPYPDYKFPNEIFTDESLERNQYGRPYLNIEEGRIMLFDETNVGNMLLKEKIRDRFANSFLVVSSKSELKQKIFYAKLGSERKNHLKIGTCIHEQDGIKVVDKFPLNEASKKHIEQTFDNAMQELPKGIHNVIPQKICDLIRYPYIEENSVDELIAQYIKEKDRERILKLFKDFWDKVLTKLETVEKDDFYSERFTEWFGEEKNAKKFKCVKNINIDLISDNIFIKENDYYIIDTEWRYDDWIPTTFLVWRAINDLYAKHTDLEELDIKDELYKIFGIDKSDEEIFISWGGHFVSRFAGVNARMQIYKDTIEIALKDSIPFDGVMNSNIIMSLYIDYGEGLSEDTKAVRDVSIDNEGNFSVAYTIRDGQRIKGLRFDPLEGHMCSCKINNLSDGFQIIGSNADSYEEEFGEIFYHTDPQYWIQLKTETDELVISGRIRSYGEQDAIEQAKRLSENLREKQSEFMDLNERQEEFREQLRIYAEALIQETERTKLALQELSREQKELSQLSEELSQERIRTEMLFEKLAQAEEQFNVSVERIQCLEKDVSLLSSEMSRIKSLWIYKVYRFFKKLFHK